MGHSCCRTAREARIESLPSGKVHLRLRCIESDLSDDIQESEYYNVHSKDYYLVLRAKYEPDNLRMIFIAESPPISGEYLYDPVGRTTEPLFRALMHATLGIRPATKAEGLAAFTQAGFVLIDSTCRPVNALSEKECDQTILTDYPELKADLLRLSRDQSSKILLIKANVCRLLERRLIADGFNVVNHGAVIPFPGSGHQAEFLVKVAQFLK